MDATSPRPDRHTLDGPTPDRPTLDGPPGERSRVDPVSFEDPDVQLLVAEVQEEYVRRYGGPDVNLLEPGVFESPRGAFYLARDASGEPVAMGGWRRRSDVAPWGLTQAAEVKRMYVVPGARRQGWARTVLSHLEDSARAAGAEVMVLETGLAQPEAVTMYVATGYLRIDAFGHYAGEPLQRCFGKPL